jgi:hypothetical protein
MLEIARKIAGKTTELFTETDSKITCLSIDSRNSKKLFLFFNNFFLALMAELFLHFSRKKPRKPLTKQTLSLRLLHSDQTNLKFQIFAAPNST